MKESISFQIPQGKELPQRLDRVLEVLYLIFNEGFHSNRKEILIRKELCGEAIRLCKMLLTNPFTQQSSTYALFALMCFQAARLDSKTNAEDEMIDLRHQDRTTWYRPLIVLGHQMMTKAVATTDYYSTYHYEAAIVAEHLKASSFEATNWDKILMWHEKLYDFQPSPFTLLNMAIVQLQRGEYAETYKILRTINPADLEQRAYLYYGSYAEYFVLKGDTKKALEHIDTALQLVRNEAEKQYLMRKKELMF